MKIAKEKLTAFTTRTTPSVYEALRDYSRARCNTISGVINELFIEGLTKRGYTDLEPPRQINGNKGSQN